MPERSAWKGSITDGSKRRRRRRCNASLPPDEGGGGGTHGELRIYSVKPPPSFPPPPDIASPPPSTSSVRHNPFMPLPRPVGCRAGGILVSDPLGWVIKCRGGTFPPSTRRPFGAFSDSFDIARNDLVGTFFPSRYSAPSHSSHTYIHLSPRSFPIFCQGGRFPFPPPLLLFPVWGLRIRGEVKEEEIERGGREGAGFNIRLLSWS